jgi:hypothetical protein
LFKDAFMVSSLILEKNKRKSVNISLLTQYWTDEWLRLGISV